MDFKAFEIEMTRLMLFWVAVSIVSTVLGFWISYLVIKCAIRDGINESRLGDRWQQTVQRTAAPVTARAELPDMRADR
ncbi:MAG: hypothetical protein EON54_06700 [Alcaligenaceae bacterium]|nr:MAG: hypothetical protein EON54_06700 [Alcaligenaceae bacterium]